MFGYVKVDAPELRVREAEYYRAVYCGLCRAMRRSLGFTSSLALSYDTVFMILTRMALAGESGELRRRRCFKLRSRMMMEPNSEIMYGAGVLALLTYHKLDDDVRDERGVKRLGARGARRISRRHLRRAGIDHALSDFVAERLRAIYALESERKSGEREFGELLGEVFAHGLDGGDERIAREIGRGVGRYIYIIDAVDDMEDDARDGRWNPVAADGADWGVDVPKELLAGAMREAVRLTLSCAGSAAELIDGGTTALEIVKNALFSGMPKEADRIINKRFCGEENKN